ncbi:MAG: metalloregulator ArsR/SmtB family transcription factor [Flavobacteriales bacterium]
MRRDPFQAIADPTRRAILVLLASQTMTAGAIANEFNAARPTISKHIQILNECELIESTQQGREIYYELKAEKMKDIDNWLEQFRNIWESRFNQLDNLLSNLKNKEQ